MMKDVASGARCRKQTCSLATWTQSSPGQHGGRCLREKPWGLRKQRLREQRPPSKVVVEGKREDCSFEGTAGKGLTFRMREMGPMEVKRKLLPEKD